ncbi:MAG: tetratricopeptide repeat protein [Pirellulaceae bacterium]|nr:tetratricopeptide repeat protein [Pirellulaceae bacterium]
MAEIRLLFTAANNAWTVQPVFERAGSPASRGDAVPLTFDLDDRQQADLRWYLEDYMDLPDHGSQVRAGRIEGEIATWGKALYRNVFGADANSELIKSLLAGDGKAASGGTPSSPKLTVATDDAHALRLPWELLADDRGPLARRVNIRRQLESAREGGGFHVGLPLRILLVVSRPDDLGFIDPRLTTRSILDALSPLGDENVVVDFCRPPTLARMDEMLSRAQQDSRPYTIVHFDGHGTYDPVLGLGVLCFERAAPPDQPLVETKTDPVRAERLGQLLAAHRIPLAILEACRSGQMDNAVALRGVAPRLVAAGVGSVVAMSHAVHVEATRVLLDRFYRELVAGASIGQALDHGRAALIAQPHRWIEPGPGGRTVALQDWYLPQLYQRGDDLVLVSEKGVRTHLPERPEGCSAQMSPDPFFRHYDVFLSHTGADKARVEAIARSLRDRHGLRVWFDAWELKGGPLQGACEAGVSAARMTAVFCSRSSLASPWVEAERQMAYAKDPGGRNILPVLLEDVELPLGLKSLLWYDLRDPGDDEANVARLAAAIGRSAVVDHGRRRPPERGQLGAFPRPPLHKFQGRARELYQLEQQFRTHRAVLLHAMGGMGKTSLAREAAYWWTRTGLFPDGACFISFEQGASPEQIALVLGTYLEGESFEQLSQDQQRIRARQLFQQKSVLVVWDNFESILPPFVSGLHDGVLDEIRELFDDWTESESGLGRLLITCRPGETGLAGARRFELHGLARADSLHLLHRVMQTAGIEPDAERLSREGLAELVQTLFDHPLSIELVGPHLAKLTPREIIDNFGPLLEQFSRGDADVQRNRSLLASLRFSTDRLSPAAQDALPWLGLFRGGVFEVNLLDISQIPPDDWDGIRAELEATALIRVESEWQLADRPYLRFHPTLPYAAQVRQPFQADHDSLERLSHVSLDEDPATRERYVGVYHALNTAIYNALHGSNPRGGMEVMAREEANFRQAVEWAVADGHYAVAGPIGNTFGVYLQMSARFRERDRWVAWLADEAQRTGWTEAAAVAERQAAWSQFTQGQPQQAVERMQTLIQRLAQTTEFDPAFQLAMARQWLGRIYDAAGAANRAIPILEQAVGQWERLAIKPLTPALSPEYRGEGVAGVPGDVRVEEPLSPTLSPEYRGEGAGGAPGDTRVEDDPRADRTALANLSATLGDLANALCAAGQLDEALETAERASNILKLLRRDRDFAASISIAAQILVLQGRYREADQRYEAALKAVRRAGDKELEGSLLQHHGGLAFEMQQYDRAVERYKRALRLFQEAGDEAGVMQTCNLLGMVEGQQARLAEARAWYERSREIAIRRQDQQSLGRTAQNIGIVCQREGQRLQEQGQEEAARQQFAEAERFLQEAAASDVARGDEVGSAQSQGQLAQLYLLMGQLDRAEEHAGRAREIGERLSDLRLLSTVYMFSKQIAQARRDEQAAADWTAKEQAVDRELARRARGGDDTEDDPDGMGQRVLQLLTNVAVMCVEAAANDSPPPPEVAGFLDDLDSSDAGPLQPLVAYLRRLGATPADQLAQQLDHPPADLPEPFPELFAQLRTAVREAGLG